MNIHTKKLVLSTLAIFFFVTPIAHASVEPVAHWKFDEGTGTTATDSSGNNNHGTISGATYSATTSPDIDFENPYSLEFDGVDDGVTTSLSLNNSGSFTLAGWVYPRSADGADGLFGANDVFEFIFTNSTTLQCWTSSGYVNWSFEENPEFLNNWHHITCLGDGDSIIMYVDGLEVANTTHAHTDNYGTGDNVSIGLGVQSPGAGPFDGFIDDVRVYAVALTPAEMLSLGTGGEEPLNNPVVTELSPANNGTDVPVDTNLSLTFNMDVEWGSGNILIKKVNEDSLVESIAVDSENVSGSGTHTLSVDLSENLEYDTEYYVQVPDTAVRDVSEELSFAGITGDSSWTFTTEGVPPPPPEITVESLENDEFENLYDILQVQGARWTSVASSPDGEFIAATGMNINFEDQNSYIYISRDGGETWNESLIVPSVVWTGIDMSPDGQTLFTVGLVLFAEGFSGAVIYRSEDAGETWEEASRIPFGEWMGVEVSFDEMLLALLFLTRIEVAEDLSHVYINMFNSVWHSTDQGETWDLSLNLDGESGLIVSSVSATATGTLAFATAPAFFGDTSTLFFSLDGGENWNEGSGMGGAQWFSSAVSSDGTRIAFTAMNDDNLYIISQEDGMVAVPHPDGYSWLYVKMASSDGRNMVASSVNTDEEGNALVSIHTSKDGGLTWERQATIDTDEAAEFAEIFIGNLVSANDLSKIALAILTDLFIFDTQELIELPESSETSSGGSGISTKQRILRKIDRLVKRKDTEALRAYIVENREHLERYVRGGTKLPSALVDLLFVSEDAEPATNIPTFPIRDLEFGMTGEDVLYLQKLLNSTIHPIAATGVGSAGNETTYFGPLTRAALATYQAANGILPSVGYFGPITRAQMKAINLSGLWW